jgi:hypothetical protein
MEYKENVESQDRENSNEKLGVLPVKGKWNGRTYSEWSTQWWKWALEQPVPSNPLLDVTGDRANLGQKYDVFFLAGTIGGEPVVRECQIPQKPLFFPVVNAEFSGAEYGLNYSDKDDKELLNLTIDLIDRVTCREVIIDGISVIELDKQRVRSDRFYIDFPKDNIYKEFYNVRAGKTPAYSDGYWILLKPLKEGRHVIKFSGEILTLDGYYYNTDTTYRINVK